MKWIIGSVCAALVAGSALAAGDRAGAATGDPTPYDSCTRTAVNATTEHLSCSFTQPGAAHDLRIPAIATGLRVFAIGGHGADTASFDPLPNTSLEGPLPASLAGTTVSIRVGGDANFGQGGYNGGGNSASGGGGGGASDISSGGSRVFVAPGGGGSGQVGSESDNNTMPAGGRGARTPNRADQGANADSPGFCLLRGGTTALDPSDSGDTSGGYGGYADTCSPVGGGYAAHGGDGTADGQGGEGGSGPGDGTPNQCGIFGIGGAGGGGGGGYLGGGGGGAGAVGSGSDCAGGGGGAAGSTLFPVTGSVYAYRLSSAPGEVTISWDQELAFTSSGAAPAGAVGQTYSYRLATDVAGSTFRVVSGSTPPGLTLSSAGLLSGRPTTVGTTGFTVEATDPDNAAQRTRVFSVTVDPAPVSFTNAPPNATKGKAYSFQFAAADCAGCAFTRVAGQGGLPHGLSLSPAGKFSGTPTTVENASFLIQATSSDGRSATQRFAMKVLAAPALAVNDVAVTESSGAAKFTITLNPAASGTVTVRYTTVNGTAKAPGDYTATSGTATFTAGQTTRTVSVPIINDTTHEGAETFRLQLSSASGASIADGSGTAAIAASD